MAAALRNLDRWLAQAEHAPVLELPRVEPHPASVWLGFGSAGVGLLAAQWEALPARETVGWASLGGLLVASAIHGFVRRPVGGWRVDFAARRVEPYGSRRAGEEAQQLQGPGWCVTPAPGDKRAHVAIDLRHDDRGRVARLLDVPARRSADLKRISALADALARRLQVERRGPQL